jgi:hypothetical protein
MVMMLMTNSDLTSKAMLLLNELPELTDNWLTAFPSLHTNFLRTRSMLCQEKLMAVYKKLEEENQHPLYAIKECLP